MKLLFLIQSVLFAIIVNAQDNALTGSPSNNLGLFQAEEATMIVNPLDVSKISATFGFYDFYDMKLSNTLTDGSYFLFDDWKNKGIILYGGKKLAISNINYNIKREQFMSQMESDSTFIFDFKGIDEIIVNERPFKRIYNNEIGQNKIYEVLYENKKLSLLKNHFVTVVESSPNPMLNRNRNKIQKQSNYWVSKNGVVSSFKLNKSDILGLSGEDSKGLISFIKENKLSYKKEADVVKMLEYLNRN